LSLIKVLDGLSPEYREVIVLARLKGLRIKEIALRMNRSENAVSLLLSRALAKLKEAFGETESFNLPARRLDGSNDGR
jgi:RNA polymerase sigma factor (sigma-70 family)